MTDRAKTIAADADTPNFITRHAPPRPAPLKVIARSRLLPLSSVHIINMDVKPTETSSDHEIEAIAAALRAMDGRRRNVMIKAIKLILARDLPAAAAAEVTSRDDAIAETLAAVPKGRPGRPKVATDKLERLRKIVAGELPSTPDERTRARKNLNQHRRRQLHGLEVGARAEAVQDDPDNRRQGLDPSTATTEVTRRKPGRPRLADDVLISNARLGELSDEEKRARRRAQVTLASRRHRARLKHEM